MSLLLVGGIALLFLFLALCLGAIIFFVVSRKPRVAPAVATTPAPTPAAHDPEATLVAGRAYGALHAIAGPLAGQSFSLRLDGMTIGRDRAQAEVIVEDPSVSKRHVWVGVRDGAVLAIDQSSTNGTYLNSLGTRIAEVQLTPGDLLILSDDAARFEYRA